jgi:glycosyltransferase involved in cell wall biosynthesis
VAKVTVVVPTYNAAPYIAQTLDSVIAQDHHDWRLIVLDDGSTDGTQDIVDGYCQRDSRISSASTPQPRGGPARARNRGIELADDDTDFFLFLDHDDWLHEHALRVLVEELERAPDAPAAYGLADEYSESLGRSRIGGPSEAYGYERFRVSGRSVEPLTPDEPTGFETLVLWSCISTTGQGLVRASELRRVGGFDPATAWSDDWDLWLRLAADRPLAFHPQFVMSKRYHDANLSSGQTSSPADWGGGLAVRRKLIRAPWLTDEQRAQARAGWRYESVMVLGWARAELRHRNYKAAMTTTVRAANAYRRYARYYGADRLHAVRGRPAVVAG